MARALPAGPAPRRRAFFGLLDADGWGWASLKAFVWFVVIIFILGYIPDRAYYFTVSRTIDLGIVAWSPVNFCPPEPNETLPCPAPVGAVTPWQKSPAEVTLPEPRVDAAFVQAGTNLILIGGSADGTTATDAVYVAQMSGTGNFDKWQPGPALPAPRADAGVAFLNGNIYVSGGYDASGKATDTTFVLKPNLQTGDLGEWQTAEQVKEPLDLPEARASAPLVALADGLALIGGVGPDGQPTKTVWKSKADNQGKLGAWTPQAELFEPAADSIGLLNGEFVWVIGGRNASGATNLVQRGSIGAAPAPEASGAPAASAAPEASPGTSGGDAGAIVRWGVNSADNLPAARVDAMGFAANGTIYAIGGSDGSSTQNEVYWAIPTPGPDGDNVAWRHLAESDLPDPGVERAAIGQVGPNMFVVGGISNGTPQDLIARTNLSPQEPFFRLGLVGATVPALMIEGEIGQQLGYLNAAGAGTVMFVLLLLVGWAFAHKEQTRNFLHRIRRR